VRDIEIDGQADSQQKIQKVKDRKEEINNVTVDREERKRRKKK
jgi:hypothetical protein